MADPVSLEEFKRQLNITSTKDDVELQLNLNAAVKAIEKRIGPILTQQFTERVTVSGRGHLVVAQTPTVAVVSLTSIPAGVTWTPDQLDVDPAGIIRPASGARFSGGARFHGVTEYDVTYTAGRGDTASEDHKLAILITAEHLWETQRGNGVRPAMFGMAPEGSATSAHEADYVYLGFALPRRALELISGDDTITFA